MSEAKVYAPEFIRKQYKFEDLAAVTAAMPLDVMVIHPASGVAPASPKPYFISFLSAAIHLPNVNSGLQSDLVFTTVGKSNEVSNTVAGLGGVNKFYFFSPDPVVKAAVTHSDLSFFLTSGVLPDGFFLTVFYYVMYNPFT